MSEDEGPWRDHTISGTQLVQVDHRYTYRWEGQGRLAVGDEVMVPASWVDHLNGNYAPKLAIVTSLGSTYYGDMSTIVSKKG